MAGPNGFWGRTRTAAGRRALIYEKQRDREHREAKRLRRRAWRRHTARRISAWWARLRSKGSDTANAPHDRGSNEPPGPAQP